MKTIPIRYYATVLALILLMPSCHNKSDKTTGIDSIDLLRGDITLCGNQSFGEVSFDLNCNPDVRENFDLALSLLHSFEYDEAEKAFVQVIDQDPLCVMAYWGVAMSNFHSLWMQSGTEYLKKGSEILKAARPIQKTEKEKDYLYAISAFYNNWESLDRQTRIKKFEKGMEEVYKKYPNDKEAAIFFALALTASADPSDKSYKNQLKSGKILESLYPNEPNHPGIAHYIIHNYDYPELAGMALPTARRYAKIAPSSAHAQHMPSHIFTRLGLWDESIQSNLNSTAAALCYSESFGGHAHWDEELHGMDYLVYAYLQVGDTKKAIEQYDYLSTFKKVFPENFKVAYTAAAIPTRIALETRNWQMASELQLPTLEIEWEKFPWQEAILHFGRAMGAVHIGKNFQAENELDRMKELRKRLIDTNDEYKENQVYIQIKIIEAWMEHAKGNEKSALSLMNEAVVMENNTVKHPVTPGEVLPAEELLGDLYMETGQLNKALIAYENDLKQHPNRFNGLFGAARAATEVMDHEKAIHYFELLIDQARGSKSDRTELIQAKKYLE